MVIQSYEISLIFPHSPHRSRPDQTLREPIVDASPPMGKVAHLGPDAKKEKMDCSPHLMY